MAFTSMRLETISLSEKKGKLYIPKNIQLTKDEYTIIEFWIRNSSKLKDDSLVKILISLENHLNIEEKNDFVFYVGKNQW